MNDYPYWQKSNDEWWDSDADGPFSIYCPACGGTGVDMTADTHGLPPYDGWDDEYPLCDLCSGCGLLYKDEGE